MSITQNDSDYATTAAIPAWSPRWRSLTLVPMAPADAEADYRRRLGRVIVELRALEEMSQAELAEQLPRSEAAVSRWEGGKATPTAFDLRRLAEIFELPQGSLDLLIYPPAGRISPVAERLAAAVAAGARKGRASGARRREAVKGA